MSSTRTPVSSDDADAEITPVEEIIAENRDVFETIANAVEDDDFSEKYGRRPLRLLNNDGDHA